jgi:hypothetical protein
LRTELKNGALFLCKKVAENRASVAQLVEQLICNQLVGGSSPFTGSKEFFKKLKML